MFNFFLLVAGIACVIGIIISFIGICTASNESMQLLLMRCIIPLMIIAGASMLLALITKFVNGQ